STSASSGRAPAHVSTCSPASNTTASSHGAWKRATVAERRRKSTSFAEDKAFEERFRPAVAKILTSVIANNLIGAYVAPDIDDFKHNKDWGLVVDLQSLDRLSQLGVASRIRRAAQKDK